LSTGPNSTPTSPSSLSPQSSRPAASPGEPAHAGEADYQSKATLSRELSDFLVELSIAMQKHAIYPAGHPLLNDAIDVVMRKIALLLNQRDSLSIGIARRQLIIEGVGTDPSHPLLKELAGKLHKHSLGALRFSSDLTKDELREALATIGTDPGRGAELIGDKALELSEKWKSVRLYPLNYERLELLYEGKDDEGGAEARAKRRGASAKAAQLWVGMARAAMMLDDDAEMTDESSSPLVVADAIDKNRHKEKAYDQVIVGYLLQIAEELKGQGKSPEAFELQGRISEMVKGLSQDTLKKLLHMGGDLTQQRQFLLNASEGMSTDAVLDLIKASNVEGKQTISHSMMRLFSKLSKYADKDVDPVRRANAESSVREQMQKLIASWTLDDPNPTAYGKVLQTIASRDRRPHTAPEYTEIEPERILQMGFELAAFGPRFEAALTALINTANYAPLLDMLDNAPDKDFADSVWAMLDSQDILWQALSEAQLDLNVIERIVKRKGLSAVDAVLDVVERTTEQKTRDRFYDILLELGDAVGPSVARRLESARGEQRRELFLLLGRLSSVPRGFDASWCLLHTDASIRREGIRLLLKFVETREQAIVAAMTDTDERAVFYGLQAAQEGGCPPRALAIIRQRIAAGDLESSLMTVAIRVLAANDSGAAPQLSGKGRTSVMMKSADVQAAQADGGKKTMDWLIGKVAQKSRIFRRWQLQPKSPEMLASLGALASYWGQVPEVQQILNLAIKSNDPELRKAMGSQRATQKFKAMAD
jgi:hypothetical protein